jgi:hypothetical protein
MSSSIRASSTDIVNSGKHLAKPLSKNSPEDYRRTTREGFTGSALKGGSAPIFAQRMVSSGQPPVTNAAKYDSTGKLILWQVGGPPPSIGSSNLATYANMQANSSEGFKIAPNKGKMGSFGAKEQYVAKRTGTVANLTLDEQRDMIMKQKQMEMFAPRQPSSGVTGNLTLAEQKALLTRRRL